jgi:hypothetical protein
LNVFGTPDFTSTWTALTLPQFYAWLGRYPDAAATFNHPGNYDFLRLEFLHFLFFPDVGRQVVGIELLTHNAEYEKYSVGYVAEDGLGHLEEANHAGWRVASVSAQDNHAGGWGTIDEYRTAVLARALTQEGILAALRKRRFYSTQDRNLVMSFVADGREMGAVLGPGDKTFAVTLDDGDGEGFASIVRQRRAPRRAAPWETRTWEFDVPAGALSWYYVLVTQADGGQAMSAPTGWRAGGPAPPTPADPQTLGRGPVLPQRDLPRHRLSQDLVGVLAVSRRGAVGPAGRPVEVRSRQRLAHAARGRVFDLRQDVVRANLRVLGHLFQGQDGRVGHVVPLVERAPLGRRAPQ